MSRLGKQDEALKLRAEPELRRVGGESNHRHDRVKVRQVVVGRHRNFPLIHICRLWLEVCQRGLRTRKRERIHFVKVVEVGRGPGGTKENVDMPDEDMQAVWLKSEEVPDWAWE